MTSAQTALSSVVVGLTLALLASPLGALDYPVKAIQPRLVHDEATSFLVDFSRPTETASFAVGEARLESIDGTFVPDGGFQGSFQIQTAGNLDPLAWTLEFVLRIPKDAKIDRGILSHWVLKNGAQVHFRQGGGTATSCQIFAGKGAHGRTHEFHVQMRTGGNGRSLPKDAPGTWVYVAFGLDMKARRAAAIVRDLQGRVLNQDMEYAGSGGLLEEFLKKDNVPANERIAAAERCWDELAKTLPGALPDRLAFCDASIEVRAMRISNCFRTDLVAFAPDLPEAGPMLWTPATLDPKAARQVTATRQVGYPGYRNTRDLMVTESVLPLTKSGSVLEIRTGSLAIGLYSFFVHGAIDPNGRAALERVWKPCPLEFEVCDEHGARVGWGRRLLKQAFRPRRMQGFHFHVDAPGQFTARFRLAERAEETALLQKIVLVNRVEGLPNEVVKTEQTLLPGTNPRQLDALSAERQARDDLIWNALPPLNSHLQVHGQVKLFLAPPNGYALEAWGDKAFQKIPHHQHGQHVFEPLVLINAKTGAELSYQDLVAGKPWPGAYPDDGCGIYFPKEKTYYCPRAGILGYRFLKFAHAITEHESTVPLGKKYHETGDPEVGHDAAMALVRFAYDWPALEMNLHEIRLCTHSPDFEFNTDWSDPNRRNGKYYYAGWSGNNCTELMTTYDKLFPYIRDNQVFAAAVHRHIPWIRTPEDVVRFLDRWLVFGSVRDFNDGLARAAPVEDVAGDVLGPHPLTARFFDLTRAQVEIYPTEGTFQELYATALSRCGSYHIASFLCYAFGSSAELLEKADKLRKAKERGVKPRMDLTDVDRYPKVRAAGDFLIDMFFAGGFPAMIGDASGGTHTGLQAEPRLKSVPAASEAAFRLWGDRRHAWLLKHLRRGPSSTTTPSPTTTRIPRRRAARWGNPGCAPSSHHSCAAAAWTAKGACAWIAMP